MHFGAPRRVNRWVWHMAPETTHAGFVRDKPAISFAKARARFADLDAMRSDVAREHVIDVLDGDEPLWWSNQQAVDFQPALVAAARHAGDPLLLVEALLWRSVTLHMVGRADECRAQHAKARAIAERLDDAGSLSQCEIGEALVDHHDGNQVQAIARVRKAFQAAALARNPTRARIRALGALALFLNHLQMFEECAAVCEQLQVAANEHGSRFWKFRAGYLSLHSRLPRDSRAANASPMPARSPEVHAFIVEAEALITEIGDPDSAIVDGLLQLIFTLLVSNGSEAEGIALWRVRGMALRAQHLTPVTRAFAAIYVDGPEAGIAALLPLVDARTGLKGPQRTEAWGALAIAYRRARKFEAAVEAMDRHHLLERQGINELARMQATLIKIDLETEREKLRAQRALVHAGKLAAVGQLASSLAHEIAQPAAALRLLCDEASEHVALQHWPEVVECIGDADAQVERLRLLVNRMKDFSRDDPVQIRPLPLVEVVEEAHRLLRPSLKDAHVLCDIDVPHLIVETDRDRIVLSLVNLVNNALDVMRHQQTPPPRLRIEARAPTGAEAILLTVSDNGPGLSKDVKARLFEPFFTTKASGHGLGLGLTITLEALKGIGASLDADNGPSGGARFTLRIPVLASFAPSGMGALDA